MPSTARRARRPPDLIRTPLASTGNSNAPKQTEASRKSGRTRYTPLEPASQPCGAALTAFPPSCYRSNVDYAEQSLKSRKGVAQNILKALEDVGRGMSLRKAADAHEGVSYTSLNTAWVKMGGKHETSQWQAFVATLPPKPAEPPPSTPERPSAGATAESALAPRLERKATRFGDGVPYGKHGSWGKYREGIKEMTQKIHDGKITPSEASAELLVAGVVVAAKTLERKAVTAPGKSPIKAGSDCLLEYDMEEAIHEQISFFRMHSVVFTKTNVFELANSYIAGTEHEQKFKGGVVTNKWYYGFLDRWDMTGEDSKPLEIDRAKWLTSTVCSQLAPPPTPLASPRRTACARRTHPAVISPHLPRPPLAECREAVRGARRRRPPQRDGDPQPRL